MEEHCNLESFIVTDNGAVSCSDRPLNQASNGRENENLDVELLAGLESYLQDINDRPTISRMVKDSVIKGMVSAVEQEAEEKIGEKTLEMAGPKEALRACRTVEDGGKLSHVPLSLLNEGNTQQDSFLVVSNTRKDRDGNSDFLRSFISEVKEQLGKLKKEVIVNNVKGGNHCRSINSGDELAGLGSNSPEEVSERLIGVDSTFSGLQRTLDSFFSQLKDMVDIREMQQEWELTAEIEAIVVAEYIRSLHREFERKLWDLNSYSRGCENFSSLKKMKEITALREELVVLSNLLSGNDNGKLVSQVSLEDGEECLINKKSDNLNRKLSGNHLPSASPWEGSGKHDELIIAMPENLDPAQLKDMPRDELISYFKREMTNMKRNYESKVHEITEEVYSLKREYFKERGSPLTARKDKEFEGLKRKIPEVVSKLDDILMESNSVAQSNGDAGSLGTMRDRLEDLLAESHQLRGILSDKKKEVKCLLSQISEDAKRISSHSSAGAKLLEMIQEDAQVEASISEEVYKCIIKEMMAHMHHISGDLYNQKSIGEDLLAENHLLRGILSDKKEEVKCLLSQISEDAKQISSHSSTEAKLLEMIRNVTCKREDAQVEASVSEEVYKCIIKEMMALMHHISGDLYNQKSIREDVQEIACVADCSCRSEFENLNMDSVILRGLDGMIFAEVLKDAKEKLCHLNDSYVNEMKHGVSLELEAMERERSLASKILENEKLKQETTWLAVLVGEKEELAQGTARELSIQMKKCEIISHELDQLRAESSRQQILIAEMNEKSELMEGNLAQGLEQIKTYQMELKNLDEKLNLAVKELSKANEERGLLLAATQEKENGLLSLRAKERENLEQLESTTGTIHELLMKVADLEQSISEDIHMKNMRLDTLGSQLSSLKQKAVALRRMGPIYEQRLERRGSNLQKAEAEVNLLGDQVDKLSNLLEKVYIGLDHYSPILQHYPGIMEVLKLLRRELTGESL